MNNLEPVVKCYNSPDEVPPELDPNAKETYKYMSRQKRNELLKSSDIYLLPDFPISPENLIIMKAYRQALRDFTNNNFILPDEPNFLLTMNK
jgi:hypothetical protein